MNDFAGPTQGKTLEMQASERSEERITRVGEAPVRGYGSSRYHYQGSSSPRHRSPQPPPRSTASSSEFRPGLLDQVAVRRVIGRARSIFENVANDRCVNQSGVLHLVIMDPSISPADGTFEQAILHEESFGLDVSEWDADYAEFARAKARLSWRTGRESHLLQTAQPFRLVRGDTALWGSVVLDGLVVAVSGAEPAYDEALSGVVAMLLRAEAKMARAALTVPFV
jgi:hypothetical protein